jgi:hypothetical protein
MKTPAYLSKEYKEVDIFGWFMSLLGMFLMYNVITTDQLPIYNKIIAGGFILFLTIGHIFRVAYGRVYKVVYYDTIFYKVYEVSMNGNIHNVCAPTEEELNLYMEGVYPDVRYKILNEKNVESFTKTEEFM